MRWGAYTGAGLNQVNRVKVKKSYWKEMESLGFGSVHKLMRFARENVNKDDYPFMNSSTFTKIFVHSSLTSCGRKP